MDKVQNLEEVQKAKEAESILNNKIISEAFETVERQYIDALLTASDKDDLGRFRFSEAIKVVRMVKQHLAVIVNNGRLSDAELKLMSGKRRSFF